MLFTPTQVPRQQTASALFQSYGANNLAPTVVSESRLFAYPADKASYRKASAYDSLLPAYIKSFSTKTAIANEDSFGVVDSSFKINHENSEFLFPIPVAVTTFTDVTEGTKAKIEALGFKRTSLGRMSFFEGSPSPDVIMKLAQLDGELFAYSPQQRVSLGGAMTAYAIRRLLYATYAVSEGVSHTFPIDARPKKLTGPLLSRDFNPSLIPDNATGHFCPYFPGLLLPDKSIIQDIISIFSRNLGESATTRSSTTMLFSRGWPSLHNTTAGRIISHMVYCLRVGMVGGFTVIPVFFRGDYSGTVLIGTSSIIYGTVDVSPVARDVLLEEVASVARHEAVLSQIVEILREEPLVKTGAPRDIDVEQIKTPRSLHYLCMDRKVSEPARQKISPLIKSLRFSEPFYKVLDEGNLLATLEAIVTKTRPDHNVPFDIRGPNIFTRSVTLSALSAYGPIAPSPIDEQQNNVSLQLKKGFQQGTTQGTLEGLPIFAKPIQQAAEDWKTLKRTGNIVFRCKGQTPFGVMRVANIGRYISSGQEADQILKLAYTYASRKADKRKRKDSDDEGAEGARTESSEKHLAKRRKAVTQNDAFFVAFDWQAEVEDMEE